MTSDHPAAAPAPAPAPALRSPVSITARFSLPGGRTERHHLDASNCRPAVLGLPDGVEPSKPEPGDYGYSGTHDHGPLVPPREGGDLALLVGCADAARTASDGLLTGVIEEEKGRKKKKEEEEKRRAEDGGKEEETEEEVAEDATARKRAKAGDDAA